jgi:hypothetical protein
MYDVEVRWKERGTDHWISTYFMILADDMDDAYVQAEEKFMGKMSEFGKEKIDTYEVHDILPVLEEIR